MTGYDVVGKTVFVTGGGSGLGRATAVMAAACGARVVVADRDAAGARDTAAMIFEAGGEAAGWDVVEAHGGDTVG